VKDGKTAISVATNLNDDYLDKYMKRTCPSLASSTMQVQGGGEVEVRSPWNVHFSFFSCLYNVCFLFLRTNYIPIMIDQRFS